MGVSRVNALNQERHNSRVKSFFVPKMSQEEISIEKAKSAFDKLNLIASQVKRD
jgi:hypothetical protein